MLKLFTEVYSKFGNKSFAIFINEYMKKNQQESTYKNIVFKFIQKSLCIIDSRIIYKYTGKIIYPLFGKFCES